MLRSVRGRRAGRWLLVAALATAGAPGCSGEPGVEAPAGEAAEAAADLRLAPDFELRVLDGGSLSLASLRGRTVLIDFWATWCAPCIFQIPILNEFYAAHRGEDVAVLGVSIDVNPEEVIPPFIDENPIHYPVLLGDEDLARQFGAPGFPALVVVDPQGRIVYLHVGLAEPEDLEAVLAAARAGATPS
jgi:thiol-disulfide isomerase/thioredoxin